MTLIRDKHNETNPEQTLKIYRVNKASLKEFAPEDDRKYNFENFPEEEFRMKDLEIAGTQENDESMSVDDDMFRATNGNLDNL